MATETLEGFGKELAADFAKVNSANDNLIAAEATMTAIAIKVARHALPNGPMPRLSGKPGDIGKWAYGQSGKSPVTDASFSSQASKIAKVIKLAQRWDNKGMATVQVAADAVDSGYNKLLSLISTINLQTAKATEPPTADAVRGWATAKPKREAAEANVADMLDDCLTMLGTVKEKAPSPKLDAVIKGLIDLAKSAGMTSAELKAAKLSQDRNAGYAALLGDARKKAA